MPARLCENAAIAPVAGRGAAPIKGGTPGMKDQLSKLIISLVAGLCLGFGIQSVASIGFQKMRTAELLGEAVGEIRHLDDGIKAFHARRGRYPRDPAEMLAAGLWTVDQPPVERLRGGARWVRGFDGRGGFMYDSATGQVFLNVDLKNDKLRSQDADEIRQGGIVPPGQY